MIGLGQGQPCPTIIHYYLEEKLDGYKENKEETGSKERS
jgi:hypothetical protein